MKANIFTIRLADEFKREDKKTLNEFLRSVEVENVTAKFQSKPEKAWSIIVFYNELCEDYFGEDGFSGIDFLSRIEAEIIGNKNIKKLETPEVEKAVKEPEDSGEMKKSSKAKKKESANTIQDSPKVSDNDAKLQQLKTWRQEQAVKTGLPQYMICTNADITNLLSHRPETLEQLRNIKGFGENKVAKFGQELLNLLAN